MFYIDATSGINANFETGTVSDDGFGSVDTVLNFERVYGSYHDDIVQLSHDIYRGYTPLYGNDTIKGPSTQEIVNNSYVGYWNLENADLDISQKPTPTSQKRISFSILMLALLISILLVVFTTLSRLVKQIIRIPSQGL